MLHSQNVLRIFIVTEYILKKGKLKLSYNLIIHLIY
jgi:hypothetical protein